MSYSNFTLLQVRQKLGISHKLTAIFPKIEPINPSPHLQQDVEEGISYPLSTEKARSEYIVTPILREVKRNDMNFVTIFSGYALNIDYEKGLNGNCDFILSARTDIADLSAPICCIVEAKKGVIEDAYGQCAAEMYASVLFNTIDGNEMNVIYGVVTNAIEWQFMCLDFAQKIVFIDVIKYKISELATILGVFRYILHSYKAE